MKKLYEVNWHHVEDIFSHVTVTAITVTREGILPGCSGVSIDAVDSQGRRFTGDSRDYYASEEEAWEAVKQDLLVTVETNEITLVRLTKENQKIREFLATL